MGISEKQEITEKQKYSNTNDANETNITTSVSKPTALSYGLKNATLSSAFVYRHEVMSRIFMPLWMWMSAFARCARGGGGHTFVDVCECARVWTCVGVTE